MSTNIYEAAIADVTAVGQPYATEPIQIDDVEFIAFSNAPKNLTAVYRSGLQHADKDFYVYQDERYTFEDAWQNAAKAANALLAEGCKRGDRIGISLRNYPEWIWAFMGITAIGGVAVALNAWWTAEEMIYGIKDSGLRLLFADRERVDRISPHTEELGLKVVSIRDPENRYIPFDDFLLNASIEMPDIDIDSSESATLLYTSGSTAHPKGVLSKHVSIANALLGWEAGGMVGMRMMQLMREASGESAPQPAAVHQPQTPPLRPAGILSVPLFHVTGLVVQLLSCFRGGRKLVGMYKWDADEALRIIEQERITSFNGVPTMSWELAQSPKRKQYDLSSLQSAGGGGAPMAPEQARQIDTKLAKGGQGTGWGMTETQGLATSIGGEAFRNRPRSCGRAIPPLVRVKAVDEDNNDLPANATGELCIWGVMNFSEYWNNPEATAETLVDGWVHTGDIGHLDDEGYVFITDRKKDIVIRGGENIGCQEVEAILYEHPAVLEACVFGIPDERLGETVAAVVCRRSDHQLTEDDLKAFAGEHLARFQIPERIWVRSERLPRTASEKIFKRQIRNETLELLKQENHDQ